MLLSDNDIKSELSYAYLHAVASRAGMACEVAGRHSDGAGVDATIRAKERFDSLSIYTQFSGSSAESVGVFGLREPSEVVQQSQSGHFRRPEAV